MPERRHVLMLLANGFRPDPRVQREARTLLRHGFAVTILCLDRDCDLAPEQIVDGIRVVRIRVGRVAPGQAASVGPALARFYAKALPAAAKLSRARRVELVHCHDFDTVTLGLLLGARLRTPVVYDMHDLYSSFFRAPWLERAVQQIDRLHYRAVDAQIVVNEGFFHIPGIGRDKTIVVMNVPDQAGSEACARTDVGLFYAGNLEARRDMRYALPIIARAGLSAQFAGDGPLLSAHRALAAADMQFLGRIPHTDVVTKTKHCLAVLSLYDTTFKNNALSTPNKLFDAMKFGKPTIVCEGTVSADIVREHDCGLVVRYGDPQTLAHALAALQRPDRYAELCRNALAAFREKYHWELMEQRLLALYGELLAGR